MRLNNIIVGTVVGLSLLMPAITQAAGLSSDQITAVVNLLQSFNVDAKTIANVQNVLTNHSSSGDNESKMTGTTTWMYASTTPPTFPPGQVGKMECIALSRNLTLGTRGDDVRKLQDMLAADPEDNFTASSTGYFGPLTEHAMMLYQLHNGIASSSQTDGSVGPLTRGFFERSCGAGLNNNEKNMHVVATSSNDVGTTTTNPGDGSDN